MKPNGYEFTLYNYVKKYFRKNFVECYLMFKDGRMSHIDKQYVNFISENIFQKCEPEDIKNGSKDEFIHEQLELFLTQFFTKKQREECKMLYRYIRELLEKKLIISGFVFSEDVLDHVIKEILFEIYPQYSESRLDTNEFNELIMSEYKKLYKDYSLGIKRNLQRMLNTFDFSFFIELDKLKVKQDELIIFVVNSILINEDRDFVRKISSSSFSVEQTKTRTYDKVKKYINNFIKYRKNMIAMNNDMAEQIDGNKMRANSVKSKNGPNGIKKRAARNKMNKSIIALLIFATLAGSAYGVGTAVKEKQDARAVAVFESVDGFDYSRRYLRNDEYYDNMAKNIIRLYLKFNDLDSDLYKTLGFYEAYEGHVEVYGKEPSVQYMDKIFQKVRNEVRNYEDCKNLDQIVKSDDTNLYCYLDFVYDRLAELGHDEVNSDKYQYALLRYKYANYGTHFGVVGVFLSEEQHKLIDDVMHLYYDYCQKAKLEVGHMMTDGEHTFFEVEGTLKGVKK